jgi:hypothetical protein
MGAVATVTAIALNADMRAVANSCAKRVYTRKNAARLV